MFDFFRREPFFKKTIKVLKDRLNILDCFNSFFEDFEQSFPDRNNEVWSTYKINNTNYSILPCNHLAFLILNNFNPCFNPCLCYSELVNYIDSAKQLYQEKKKNIERKINILENITEKPNADMINKLEQEMFGSGYLYDLFCREIVINEQNEQAISACTMS